MTGECPLRQTSHPVPALQVWAERVKGCLPEAETLQLQASELQLQHVHHQEASERLSGYEVNSPVSVRPLEERRKPFCRGANL